MSYQAIHLASEPSRAEVDALPGLVLLEFGAPWCPHCIAAQAPLAKWLGTHAGIAHIKIEDGRGQPLGRSLRVKLWPTLVLLQSGQELARVVRPVQLADFAALDEALPQT